MQEETLDQQAARELRIKSAKLLGWSAVAVVLAMVGVSFGVRPIGFVFCGLLGSLAVVGVVFAIGALARGGFRVGVSGVAASVGLLLLNLAMANIGAFGAYLSTVTFSRGRQLRRRGKTLLPPVGPGDAWAKPRGPSGASGEGPEALAIDCGPDSKRALASQWRENGRTEHASVAAFAKLSLDLVTLGAPPELIAASNRDALDEIRHAELCFSLARAIDGSVESPTAFPELGRAPSRPRGRTMALAELAVESLVDGALNEGVSARIVARLARRCAEPTIKELLKGIAADEGRHAAHGWDVVRWCLDEGGAPVAHALAGALGAIPNSIRSTLDPLSREGGWERWGIPGAALEADELAKTHADVARRVEKLVAPYAVSRSRGLADEPPRAPRLFHSLRSRKTPVTRRAAA